MFQVIYSNIKTLQRTHANTLFIGAMMLVVTVVIYGSLLLRFDGLRVDRHQWISHFAEHKRELLAKRYPDEHVLIASGDSTTLFGIDAVLLSDALNRPVFNFGLGAASGLSTVLDETLKVTRNGDTVLLMVSDRLLADRGGVYLNEALVGILDHDVLFAMPFTKQLEVAFSVPWLIVLFGFGEQGPDSHFSSVYSVKSLNPFGDIKASVFSDNTPPELPNKVVRGYPISSVAIQKLKRFQTALSDKDCELTIVLSPRLDGHIGRSEYQATFANNIERLSAAGFTVLTSSDDLSEVGFSKELLYDFDEHPNVKGRVKFTGYVAERLQRYHF